MNTRLPVVLSAAALAGVLLLFFLYLGQRGTDRELRALILNERANAALNANAGADAEALLAEVYELNPNTPAVWRRRAIARMMFSGSAAKYPDMRMIFSHAGGTMPFLAERLIRTPSLSKAHLNERVPQGVKHELQKFYYDTAQTSHPYAMASARQIIQIGRAHV